MSRLDEIKARAEAATPGPWVRDMHSPDMSGRSGWYIRGPRKLGLRSMVLNSRMLPGDAEFIEHAREDVPWLIERVQELSGAICWDTTCLNCASLLDSNYDQYVRAEIAEAEVERLTDLCDEFRKREESQDRIRQRLTAEVERLQLNQAGKVRRSGRAPVRTMAIAVRTNVQLSGSTIRTKSSASRGWIDRSERQEARARRAEAEVARLTAERDAAIERLERVIDQWRKTGRAVISEMNRADKAEAERDALAAQVARVEEVLEHWRTVDEGNAAYAERIGERSRFADGLASRADMLRAALTGSETDTSDTQSTDQEVKS